MVDTPTDLNGYSPHCECDDCVAAQEIAMFNRVTDDHIPFLKKINEYDKIHGPTGRNMPTWDESACLPLIARIFYRVNLEQLYNAVRIHRYREALNRVERELGVRTYEE